MHEAAEHHAVIVAAGSSRRLAHLTRDRPKSLLDVGGRPLVEHGLAALESRGVERLTLVVGYRAERLVEALGERYGALAIDYALSADYATTEHGWSLYQARESWEREHRPVLFLDADALYDPRLLDQVLATPGSTVTVERAVAPEVEDELVLGASGRVTGLRRGSPAEWPQAVGAFVGVNRFSAPFTGALFAFMQRFFAEHGRGHKYERVIDALLAEPGADLAYVATGGLPWVNVNHENDLERARRIARSVADAGAGPVSPGVRTGGC